MSRSVGVFIRCTVVALAAIIPGLLQRPSLYAQSVSPQALGDMRAACAWMCRSCAPVYRQAEGASSPA